VKLAQDREPVECIARHERGRNGSLGELRCTSSRSVRALLDAHDERGEIVRAAALEAPPRRCAARRVEVAA
jgi:hypothetical protein